MSFEPVAADMQIVMPSASDDSEYYVGLSYTEGIGKVCDTGRSGCTIDTGTVCVVQAHQSYHHRTQILGQERVFVLSQGQAA